MWSKSSRCDCYDNINLYGKSYNAAKLSFIYLAKQPTFHKQKFTPLPAMSEAMARWLFPTICHWL